MLPIAVDQSAYSQLTHSHRGQAPSYLFTVLCQDNWVNGQYKSAPSLTDTQQIKVWEGACSRSRWISQLILS